MSAREPELAEKRGQHMSEESATGQALLELDTGAAPGPPGTVPTAAAWRHQRRVADRIVRTLEPLEPDARRRILAAVAILFGHDRLACELIHASAEGP